MINAVIILVMAVCVIAGIKSTVRHIKGEGGCCGGGCSTVKIEPSDKNRKNYNFIAEVNVPDMTCPNCVAKISNALNSKDGIWVQKINLKTKKSTLLLKDFVTQEQIENIILQSGYKPENYTSSAVC